MILKSLKIWMFVEQPLTLLGLLNTSNKQPQKNNSNFWCLVSGVWCLVSGVWYLVSGVWCLASGFWRLVSGVWCLLAGVWCLGSNHRGRAESCRHIPSSPQHQGFPGQEGSGLRIVKFTISVLIRETTSRKNGIFFDNVP